MVEAITDPLTPGRDASAPAPGGPPRAIRERRRILTARAVRRDVAAAVGEVMEPRLLAPECSAVGPAPLRALGAAWAPAGTPRQRRKTPRRLGM
jgi:hypothetical protein